MAAAVRGAEASAAPRPRRMSVGKIEQPVTSVTEHNLHIEAFESLPSTAGQSFKGPRFEAGGQKWYLKVFPAGKTEGTKEYVGVFLHYAGSRDGISASFTLEATHSACPGVVYGSKNTTHTFARLAPGVLTGAGWLDFIRRSRLYGKTGMLIVKCVLTVEEGERRTSLVTGPQNLVAVAPPSLGGSMKVLLDAGTLSDVVLQSAQDQTGIKAHRNILASRSPVFAAMFTGGMVEASASSDPISIADVSGAVLRAMVHFIYVDELPTDAAEHLECLLAAADQYQLPRLASLCEEQLCAGMTIENVAARLVVAELHSAAQLKEYCLDYIGERPAEVMATEGWQQLGTQPNLLQELFAHAKGVRKRPRAEDDEQGSLGVLTAEQVRLMRVGELRAALQERGLDTSGLKVALVARLEATL